MKLQETDRRLKCNLFKAEFGIEKESFRATADGCLAESAHPAGLGGGISRDFGEGQTEFISGVYQDLKGACREICALQDRIETTIKSRPDGGEYLWNYSNPPLFRTEESIRIAEFSGGGEGKTAYREYLAEKYGKAKMLFSGMHVNFSMPEDFFALLEQSSFGDAALAAEADGAPGQKRRRLKSEWYLRLCDALMDESWLIVALTAASPVADEGFLNRLGVPEEERNAYASFRSSRYGYWNLFIPELSYFDYPSYLNSIRRYIEDGRLYSIQELYYPIRLKPFGENSFSNLNKNGVNHIELRMLDLNPACRVGAAEEDLIFIHLLAVYKSAELLGLQKKSDTVFGAGGASSDKERILLHQEAARFSFWEEQEACREYACNLLRRMEAFFHGYLKEEGIYIPKAYEISDVLKWQRQKILDPDMRYAGQVYRKRGILWRKNQNGS